MDDEAGPRTTLDNPLDALVGYRLRRLSGQSMGELAKLLEPLGLRTTEASLLMLIAANPGVTQSELGRVLGIQRANMVPLTAGLERRGLVRREKVDGRSQGLSVTADGTRLAEAARGVTRAHDDDLAQRLTAAGCTAILAAR